MAMANLPQKLPQSSIEDPYADRLVALMAQGKTPGEISREMYPGRHQRPQRRRLDRKLTRLALEDPRIGQGLTTQARLRMMADLVPIVEAMGARAKRGRVDAGKVILEASGFHNPRVQHQHSGEIKVKLEIPRPSFDGTAVEDADPV